MVLTQGTFDGVHIGHQRILRSVVNEASAAGGESVLLTFYPHPRLVLYPDHNDLKLLTTIEEKIGLVEELGIDYMIVMPFTQELSRLGAEEFVREILVNQLHVSRLIIGYDHRFGRNREGGMDDMIRISEVFGFDVDEIPAQDIESSIVSSTKIRKALLSGDVDTAEKYLGKKYSVTGKVEPGLNKGKELGFPTANIRVSSSFKLIPKNGVYAVHVTVGGKKMKGMLNIGDNPTFSDKTWSMEVHIFDFSNNLYDQELCVEFVARTRDEKPFVSVDQLVQQLKRDEAEIRKILED